MAAQHLFALGERILEEDVAVTEVIAPEHRASFAVRTPFVNSAVCTVRAHELKCNREPLVDPKGQIDPVIVANMELFSGHLNDVFEVVRRMSNGQEVAIPLGDMVDLHGTHRMLFGYKRPEQPQPNQF